jgi:hypothetical protein
LILEGYRDPALAKKIHVEIEHLVKMIRDQSYSWMFAAGTSGR